MKSDLQLFVLQSKRAPQTLSQIENKRMIKPKHITYNETERSMMSMQATQNSQISEDRFVDLMIQLPSPRAWGLEELLPHMQFQKFILNKPRLMPLPDPKPQKPKFMPNPPQWKRYSVVPLSEDTRLRSTMTSLQQPTKQQQFSISSVDSPSPIKEDYLLKSGGSNQRAHGPYWFPSPFKPSRARKSTALYAAAQTCCDKLTQDSTDFETRELLEDLE